MELLRRAARKPSPPLRAPLFDCLAGRIQWGIQLASDPVAGDFDSTVQLPTANTT
jgi:hypothetical protein